MTSHESKKPLSNTWNTGVALLLPITVYIDVCVVCQKPWHLGLTWGKVHAHVGFKPYLSSIPYLGHMNDKLSTSVHTAMECYGKIEHGEKSVTFRTWALSEIPILWLSPWIILFILKYITVNNVIAVKNEMMWKCSEWRPWQSIPFGLRGNCQLISGNTA